MQVRSTTRVSTLLRRHPRVDDILGWYGIVIDIVDAEWTLAEVCRSYRLDLDDVLTDLQAVLEEAEADDDDEEEDDGFGMDRRHQAFADDGDADWLDEFDGIDD